MNVVHLVPSLFTYRYKLKFHVIIVPFAMEMVWLVNEAKAQSKRENRARGNSVCVFL